MLLESIRLAFSALKPGVRGLDIDTIARGHIVSQGYDEYPHALGHQVGRYAHDGGALLAPAWERYGNLPFMPLEKDQVFTIEPRIYVKDFGVATVEEMVVITAGGAEYLSAAADGTVPGEAEASGRMTSSGAAARRKPEWLKTRLPGGDGYFALKNKLEKRGLHTICQSARCPNAHECWNSDQATFLIMGDVCSRDCRFCAVAAGAPLPLDADEGRKLVEMAALMGLRYAVITSVTRDDLPDKGSGHFARVIRTLKRERPQLKIEVLVPDFDGRDELLDPVLDAGPDVLAHNVETVPSLYARVNRRPAAFADSLRILEHGKERGWITKTGLMVGLGETVAEVGELFRDLRRRGVDMLTIGQYLQPDGRSLPVSRYYSPEEFAALKDDGPGPWFLGVESGPFVRSSYHAEQLVPDGEPCAI